MSINFLLININAIQVGADVLTEKFVTEWGFSDLAEIIFDRKNFDLQGTIFYMICIEQIM